MTILHLWSIRSPDWPVSFNIGSKCPEAINAYPLPVDPRNIERGLGPRRAPTPNKRMFARTRAWLRRQNELHRACIRESLAEGLVYARSLDKRKLLKQCFARRWLGWWALLAVGEFPWLPRHSLLTLTY